MAKAYEVRAICDIYEADYIGNGAYEYCKEHNLFHLAAKKGELLYIPESSYKFAKEYIGKTKEACGMASCLAYSKNDPVIKSLMDKHNLDFPTAVNERDKYMGGTGDSTTFELTGRVLCSEDFK